MTTEQRPSWCSICRKEGCTCPYCHDARFVRFNGQLIRCDVCNAEPEPNESVPPPTPIRQRRGRPYSERLES